MIKRWIESYRPVLLSNRPGPDHRYGIEIFGFRLTGLIELGSYLFVSEHGEPRKTIAYVVKRCQLKYLPTAVAPHSFRHRQGRLEHILLGNESRFMEQ